MRSLLILFLAVFTPIPQAIVAQQATVPREATPSATVEGAVNRPGRVEFPQGRGLTIIEAITLAGGHTGNADLKRVWLIRTNAAGESAKTVIDVHALMKRRDGNVPAVRDGDRIVLIGRDVDE
jgi:protein involved in polysaccharide export with SLBB domain